MSGKDVFQKKIVMIAGEASGDLHGANLADALYNKRTDIKIMGIGGDRMKEAGVDLICDIGDLGVVGISEVISHFRSIKKAYFSVSSLLKRDKINLLILIDYPDFNLRVAKVAKSKGIPILYYISPQVWAWREGRVSKIARLIDKMVVILPFEKEIYQKNGVDCEFVGHPLLDEMVFDRNKESICKEFGLDLKRPSIVMLPGSRKNEVNTLLPIILDSMLMLKKENNDLQFLLAVAPSIEIEEIMTIIVKYPSLDIKLAMGESNKAFYVADYVVTASGTATLQAAIFEKPMVIIYKVSLITYIIGRLLIKTENIGLVNIVARKSIVPEFIQYDAIPENISGALLKMLHDSSYVKWIKNELSMIKKRLGSPGISVRVADIAMKFIK
ncbi:MAG: lipid-A-disaccharide synthase [Nitrospirota bacterium]